MMKRARGESQRERTMENLLSESQEVREIMSKLKERMKRTTQEEIVAGYIDQEVTQEIGNPAAVDQQELEFEEEKVFVYFDRLWSLLQRTRIQALTDLDTHTISAQQFEIRIAATAKVWGDRLNEHIKKFGAELVSKVISKNPNIS